jgi:hypothetical protein
MVEVACRREVAGRSWRHHPPDHSPQEAPLHDVHRGGASVCAKQLGGVVACGSVTAEAPVLVTFFSSRLQAAEQGRQLLSSTANVGVAHYRLLPLAAAAVATAALAAAAAHLAGRAAA